MKNTFLLFWVFFFIFYAFPTTAQVIIQQDSSYIFDMKDGNTYIGKVNILEETQSYEVTTEIGIVKLKQIDIIKVKKLTSTDIVKGTYWQPNPHSSRYFFSPSGYGLKKGEGYYQNAWIFLNQVSYGFSDNFTLGVGIVPIFLFGADIFPVWITPKLNFDYKNGKGAYGVGSIYFTVLGENDIGGVGILYGSNTFGTRDKQFTIGLGFGYSSDEGINTSPVLNLGGLYRTGKKWAFVSEMYFFGGLGEFSGIISAGMRYMGKKIAIDMAGFRPLVSDLGGALMFPWLSISVPFSQSY
ncbi:MAG: hypothetical protein WAT79_06000 [Saprospiraceae bacterium]